MSKSTREIHIYGNNGTKFPKAERHRAGNTKHPQKHAAVRVSINKISHICTVVPIVRVRHDFTVIKYNRKTKRKGEALQCYTHPFAPTFAVTFHKSQGQTLPHVVLHLHKPPGRSLKPIQFQGLYVALSRVEFGSSIRVVFDNTNGLKHLFSLKRPKNFDQLNIMYI